MKTRCHKAGNSRRRLGNRSGVVMVETVVALSIFALFLSGACKLLITHRHLSDMARAHYTAVNLAKNRLELVRTFDFGDVINFVESDIEIDSSGYPEQNGNYRRTTQLSNINSNLVELSVIIEIRDRKTLSFTGSQEVLTTYFTKQLNADSSVGSGVSPSS